MDTDKEDTNFTNFHEFSQRFGAAKNRDGKEMSLG